MSEIIKSVRWFDSALKQSTAAIVYGSTQDAAQLAELTEPGKTPAVFHIQRATRDAWRAIRRHGEVRSPSYDALETAFAACVVEVEHYPGLGASWRPVKPQQMTQDELDQFDIATIEEIGHLAIQEALLPKGCARHFPLSPTSLCVADLKARALLSAAGSRGDAPDPSNAEP